MNAEDKVVERANDAAHSATADKAKGHVKEAIGKVKETIGAVTGNRELEAKGKIQHAEGSKDRIKGEVKEKIDEGVETVKAGARVIKDKITGKS